MATLIKDYPDLLADDAEWQPRAQALADKTYELLAFLTDVMGVAPASARFPARAAYHDSCSGLRALGIKRQARQLLTGVEGLTLTELPNAEACCGFGGTFCVKYPEISGKLADDKVSALADSRAEVLLGGDLGCLLHIAGRLKRLGRPERVYHTAEVLAGMADGPGIGDAQP